MSEVNVPLLRKAVEWAEAEAAKPRELCEWYQGSWRMDPAQAGGNFYDEDADEAYSKSTDCGTCFCIAGYAASITLQPGETLEDDTIRLDGQLQAFVYDRAAEVLGIQSGPMSNRHIGLFNGSNSIEDVRRIAEELAGERL